MDDNGILANRRAVMSLFCEPDEVVGHALRIVLAEKDITVEIEYLEESEMPDDLKALNPYGTLPLLVDRELVIYDGQIALEYLDERFPHPPMMPVDPVQRVINRQLRLRIERDLYPLVETIQGDDEVAAAAARKAMRDNLTAIAPAFEQTPFFMSEEYTLADAALAPVLWRLKGLGVKLPPSARPLIKYAINLFKREAFKASLSPAEKAYLQ